MQNYVPIALQADLETVLIDFRQFLHQYPELSHQEFKTTESIKHKLLEYDLHPMDLPLKTGLVVSIKGDLKGSTIVLRGDIDALPILEEADIPFPSLTPGIMHACGHDFHATAVLGAAIILARHKKTLKGEVRIIFQAAEETGTGAKDFIKAGAIEGASAIYGLHNDPSLPLGVIGSKSGVLTAGVDRFELNIQARGSHAAKPHEGNDPIIVLAQIIIALQNIISRKISSSENAVLSITQMTSGSTWNVIPDTAYMQGTVRTFDATTRENIKAHFYQIIQGIALSFGVGIEIQWHEGPPSVNNSENWANNALMIAQKMGLSIKQIDASPIGEDFAFFQEKIPGAFIMVGTEEPYPLHHPKFKVNDAILYQTSHYLAELVFNSSANC